MVAHISYWWQLVLSYLPYLGIFTLVVSAVLLAIIFYILGEIRRLDRRLKRLAGVGEIEDLTDVLERLQNLKEVQERVERLEEKTGHILQSLESTLCRIGIIRFNAFPDTGSELSFALAVLSREGDGFILTSLYSREETRVFLKPVKRGRALYRLSEEEEKALHIALGYIAP